MDALLEEHENDDFQNTSYLNVRMQSIIAESFPAKHVHGITETTTNKSKDNLQIYLRVKTSKSFQNIYQITDDTLICKVPKSSKYDKKNNVESALMRKYTFSKIFGPETTQLEIFKDVIQDKMVDFINGVNSSLLMYGASGSGKTFTVVGDANHPGIVPRSLEFLFRVLPELSVYPSIKPSDSGKIIKLSESASENERSAKVNLLKDLQNVNHHLQVYSAMQQELQDESVLPLDEDISDLHLSVWISFGEIYNEYIYDLLTPPIKLGHPRKKLHLFSVRNKAYIKDLTYIHVTSASEAYCVLQYGLQNLNYAATSINDHSSRSHSIFTIRLAQASDTKDGVSLSAFNFCDLAGSERTKKTNNVGDRLKESNNINTSLMVLGRCISDIRDAQKTNSSRVIPYRDSKFTQLFQNALSGNEAIFMIVNINPIASMFDESQHVLNFSAIAKEVSTEQQQFIERPKNLLPENVDQEDDVNVEELAVELAFLNDAIEQKSLDYEEEREYIIQKYKEMIAAANKFGEDKYKSLQAEAFELKNNVLSANDQFSDHNDRKRKHTSVIILDSSSDEEEDAVEASKKKYTDTLISLREELHLVNIKMSTATITLQSIITKNNKTNELLEQCKVLYNDMQHEHQKAIDALKIQISEQEHTIIELSNTCNNVETDNDYKEIEGINSEFPKEIDTTGNSDILKQNDTIDLIDLFGSCEEEN